MELGRYLTHEDTASRGRLTEELLHLREMTFNAGERVIEVLTTSVLLPKNAEGYDCIALYSRVAYRLVGPDQVQSMIIVCPQDADVARRAYRFSRRFPWH